MRLARFCDVRFPPNRRPNFAARQLVALVAFVAFYLGGPCLWAHVGASASAQGAASQVSSSAVPPTVPITLTLENLQTLKPDSQTLYEVSLETQGFDVEGDDKLGPLPAIIRFPQNYDPTKAYDLIVILHGHELDHRWAFAAHPITFRQNEIVVALGGTRLTETAMRTNPQRPADVIALRDALLELLRKLGGRRVIVYGHSQGGFMAMAMASQFPRLLSGAVCHSGGIWDRQRIGGLVSIPLALVHATDDAISQYRNAIDARDLILAQLQKNLKAASEQSGSPIAPAESRTSLALVQRLSGTGHDVVPSEASRAIDWIIGLRTDDAAEALRIATSLKDPQGLETNNAMAWGVLKRLALWNPEDVRPPILSGAPRPGPQPLPKFPTPLPSVSIEQKAEAQRMMDAIAVKALRHVAALRTQLPDNTALANATLDMDAPAPLWLGHLLTLRENYKGIDAVEVYLRDIGFEALLLEHELVARDALSKWEFQPPRQSFGAITNALSSGFLFEGWPSDLQARLQDWRARAKELTISQADQESFFVLGLWQRCITKGREQFRAIENQK